MKILYMGTSAYDAIPAPFCKCRICQNAYKLGGKEVRTRNQALVDDSLLLDFNGDTISHFVRYHIDSTKINTSLITHSHTDHFCPEDIVIPQYSSNSAKVDFYVGQDGYKKLTKRIASSANPTLARENLKIHLVKPSDEFLANGYKVLALRANHDLNTSPLNYLIEKDGKSLLYAHDTGIFFEETYKLLEGRKTLDLISLDCTGGLAKSEWIDIHMRLGTNLDVLKRLKEKGLVDEHTKVVISHFSHNGNSTHEEIEKEASKYGIITAYDGLEIEF